MKLMKDETAIQDNSTNVSSESICKLVKKSKNLKRINQTVVFRLRTGKATAISDGTKVYFTNVMNDVTYRHFDSLDVT